ncbi:MAG: type II secretion system protein GspD [Bacteroidota bacterium]
MNRSKKIVATGFVALLAGCGQAPLKPAETHLQAETAPRAGAIPPPVQAAPVLPKPAPRTPPETYSVVVNNVSVHDLLFALARNAHVNVDIDPGVTGMVTLNAIDQTLPQLLTRIARQIDMRYEMRGNDLVVMRDTPYLHLYKIDYVNMARNATMNVSVSSQLAGGTTMSGSSGGGTAGAASGTTNSSSSLVMTSNNRFWDALVANVKDILRETDKVLPANAAAEAGQPAAAPAAASQAATGAQQGGQQQAPVGAPAVQPVAYREAASVIANPETGILTIRATARQHAKIQEFLDHVMASAKRQVLIEATIAEVRLNNDYQRGIDWSRALTGSAGWTFSQSSAGTPANITTNAFTVGYSLASMNFTSALKLLESFGQVRVLSSPTLTALNNQAAVMRVTNDLVYFTLQPGTTTVSSTGTGVVNAPPTFTTTPNVSPVGLIMSVVPQISDSDIVLLDVRPTIRRQIDSVPDPNPALANPCGAGGGLSPSCAPIQSLIPVIQTREMESLLRLQSGQIAVLGGLMEDTRSSTEDTVPGVNRIPFLGDLFQQRRDQNQKTELVIFLRATVVRDASLEGEFAAFRDQLPGKDFLSKPNPAREAPLVMPGN